MSRFDEEHRIKPIEEIFDKAEIEAGRIDRLGAFRSRRWTINSTMKLRFGDGEFYEFRKIEQDSSYTHMSDDGFYYHESWFEGDIFPVLDKLSEKDFIL